jgi:hypothetical protein
MGKDGAATIELNAMKAIKHHPSQRRWSDLCSPYSKPGIKLELQELAESGRIFVHHSLCVSEGFEQRLCCQNVVVESSVPAVLAPLRVGGGQNLRDKTLGSLSLPSAGFARDDADLVVLGVTQGFERSLRHLINVRRHVNVRSIREVHLLELRTVDRNGFERVAAQQNLADARVDDVLAIPTNG